MYVKLALRNAKRSCSDYMIYISTLTILSALIFSSNILAFLDALSASADNLHVLPILVSLVMVVLMNYINAFMVKRRTKELAIYTLLGMEQKTVGNLFFIETLVIGFACLLLGIIFGIILYCVFTQLVFKSDTINFAVTWASFCKAMGMTIFYFGIIQIISMLVNRYKINKFSIYQLMYGHKRNEKLKSKKKSIMYLVLSALLFLIIGVLMILITAQNVNSDLKMMSISMVSLPVIVLTYAFYIGLYHYIGNLRKERPEKFLKKNKLFIAGQLLSKSVSNSMLTATMSLCLMVAAFSCIISIVMFRSPIAIFDDNSKFFMSFVQLYICIIFTVIVFTVLALQQIVDSKDNQYRYTVLQKLGADRKTINKVIFNQVAIIFTAPLLIFGVIVLECVIPINFSLYEFFEHQNLLLSSMGIFGIILAILYLEYFFITFKTVKKNILQ